jgi:hypothetical protein
MQIDGIAEHPAKTAFSRHDHREPNSNVTATSDSHEAKQTSESRSTEDRMIQV